MANDRGDFRVTDVGHQQGGMRLLAFTAPFVGNLSPNGAHGGEFCWFEQVGQDQVAFAPIGIHSVLPGCCAI